MKKILTRILISLIIATALATTSYAVSTTNSFAEIESNTSITNSYQIASNFEAPTIPKPSTLPGPSETEQIDKTLRSILLDTILPRFTIMLIGFIGGLALLFIVIAGARFAMAYGNEEAIDKAKKQAIYGIVGLLIAILAYTIVTIIVNLEFLGNTTEQPPPEETTSGSAGTSTPDPAQ